MPPSAPGSRTQSRFRSSSSRRAFSAGSSTGVAGGRRRGRARPAAGGHDNRRRAPRAPTRYGNSQARRLKPSSIGAARTAWLPNSSTNAASTASWSLPFGEVRVQPRRLLVVVPAVGPHRAAAHRRLAPAHADDLALELPLQRAALRRRHGLPFCALHRRRPEQQRRAAAATSSRRRAGIFATRERERRLGQQRDAGAERQDAEAEPDPVHQRVDVRSPCSRSAPPASNAGITR